MEKVNGSSNGNGHVPSGLSHLHVAAAQARGVCRGCRLRVVGLFAGIGGIEIGLQRAGHEILLLCEIDPGAREVLGAHFQGIRLRGDIRDLRSLPQDTDLVAAGFPCQDLSQAGKTQGINGSASGLVNEVFRLLKRRRVPWVLLENVPFMLHLAKGHALEVIVRELECLGYHWAYRVVDSQAFGLPQRRRRLFLLASRVDDPRRVLLADDAGKPGILNGGTVAYGFYWTEGWRGLGWAVNSIPPLKGGSGLGIPSPPAILLPNGNVVKPDIRDAERMQGFDPDRTQPAESVARRSYRWKLVGNAVTVDVAEWIGRRLAAPVRCCSIRGTPLRSGQPLPHSAWNIGEGRHAANLSDWPLSLKAPLLHKFLRHDGEHLSARATAGFIERARSPRATIRPDEQFLKSLEEYLARIRCVASL